MVGPTIPPSKFAIPITTNATLIPCRSKDTSVRLNCGCGLVDGLVSAQSRFSRCAPTGIPACWLKRSLSEGRSSGREVGRGSYLPFFFIFILNFVVTSEGFRLGGSVLPPLPRRSLGGTPGPSPLSSYPQSFAMDMVGFTSHCVLR
jgi:hypothetical protein